MLVPGWLAWIQRKTPAASARRSAASHKFRPAFEQLETRDVPSALHGSVLGNFAPAVSPSVAPVNPLAGTTKLPIAASYSPALPTSAGVFGTTLTIENFNPVSITTTVSGTTTTTQTINIFLKFNPLPAAYSNLTIKSASFGKAQFEGSQSLGNNLFELTFTSQKTAGTNTFSATAPLSVKLQFDGPANFPVLSLGLPVSVFASKPIKNSLALAPTSLPAGTVGTAYSKTITPSFTGSPATTITTKFTITAGFAPAGITIQLVGNTVTVTGTPTAVGAVNFTVTSTDVLGDTVSQAYFLEVKAPAP